MYTPLPQNGNKFVILRSLEEVLANWAFFLEGLEVLNNPQGARGDVSPDAFLKLVLNVVAEGTSFGIVALLTSKNDKPLGYGICFDNTEPYCEKSALIYAAYSNRKAPHTARELLSHCEIWAKEQGFKHLHACSRRFNGAAFRLFEDVWKFSRACVVFTKAL